MAEVQRRRVRAIADFVADARGGHPEPQHRLDIEDRAFEEFSRLVGPS